MKTTVLLVRHGETEWNVQGRFQGCHDINLTDNGIEQAKRVAKRLEGSFDCVYASPLKRAFNTAKLIASTKGISPIIEDDLREINFGLWEGLTIKEMKSKFPKEFDIWRNDTEDGPLCGGDLSIKRASIRVEHAVLKIVNDNKGKNIVVVAHGGIIKAALIALFNWNMAMYHRILLGNTSICKIEFNENNIPKIVTINDVSHLPEEYAEKDPMHDKKEIV
ncbi:putative phosphoglycerate mutase [Clostridium acetobutylicum]|uniref:Possible phosphoglycerate mutase n=1 Tax=Clostridium acetobutylicum (strain ATCC 824 / DSM 792 / JCM 1419 / IAM 19013 / LMG 5710 / NBRC 13948 / NRRL B-527 / VKM B-1787 / 2291 / W) TaxID=272562 RepID=Q97ET5_CLOAB|nr:MULTISPECIES: histidine phosphatase family protein [Clostridium]AAK80962.1 Possible phosphoglycerate mutase [Clostridium acetobutylicum ATCC 824]ADZ22064.1 putative phosphoglycerate mutase [Clostridium acetobutylicum EA 2018]AEI32652.1 phosphoglycerate mutase [Clostridium acetobutylicum DSM 1731]AWV78627.1 histidine phosphatase family protein [Clostridium acetobutylicum]MBC2393488.1 histidine phosphatase family protein [Clostridium acetobutylicum]